MLVVLGLSLELRWWEERCTNESVSGCMSRFGLWSWRVIVELFGKFSLLNSTQVSSEMSLGLCGDGGSFFEAERLGQVP